MKNEIIKFGILFLIVSICFKIYVNTDVNFLQSVLYPVSFLGFIVGFTFSEGVVIGNIITTLIIYGTYRLCKFIRRFF